MWFSTCLHFWCSFSLCPVAQTVQGAADVVAAAPGAEAVPDPGAATTTAAPGPAPTPDQGPGPGPSPEPPGEASQSPLPGPGPVPGLSRGVEPRLPTEGQSPGPGRNPRAGRNLQKTTEQNHNPKLDTIRRYTGEWGGLYSFILILD